MSVVVAPWSNPNSIKGRVTPLGVEFGIPAEERSGVQNRRMAWSHPFASFDLGWIGANLTAEILDELPADWRYPQEE
jgi:hypothetical protein